MKNGDIVFTQIGSEGDAISSVTEGYCGARLNHVGIAVETTYGMFVLEAFPPEVRLTNQHVHLNRSKDGEGAQRYLLARLRAPYDALVADAIAYGMTQRDVPYDVRYMPGEAMLYCSELVVDMFKAANGGAPFFTEEPMSFTDPTTGEIHARWKSYYQYFGMDVPVGDPGSNPGAISRDDRIEIYEAVGPIDGYLPTLPPAVRCAAPLSE